jgi:hypothetical protein
MRIIFSSKFVQKQSFCVYLGEFNITFAKMHWPLPTSYRLKKNECHLLLIHHPQKLSNKADAKQQRQDLIHAILKKYTLLPFTIEITGSGKPYMNTAELHFNISHSQNILIMAISHYPVGVDFEFIRKKDYSRFSNYFWEKDLISPFPKYLQALAFFQAWTQTEAWVKFHGETIFTHSAFTPNHLLSREPFILGNCQMVSFMPMVNTLASMCYDKRIKSIKLKILNWSTYVSD